MLFRSGAYGSYGVASTFYTGALQTVTYDIPTYRFRGCRVFTNKPACGPKRGHGTPQARFGQEVQLDKIAERLNLDPADMRLNMIAPPNSLTANFMRIGTIGLAECIRKVVARSGWKDKFRKLPYGRGVGIACSSYLSGAGLPINWNDLPHSGVQLKLDRSGGVTVKQTPIYPDPDPRGYLKAIDPMTGQAKWQTGFKSPNYSGTLVTAGGLVFAGELTGEFIAVDAESGKILWQFQTPSGIIGQPVTWERNGVQYVTVTSGIGGVYARQPDPNLAHVPKGGSLWTFKLMP